MTSKFASSRVFLCETSAPISDETIEKITAAFESVLPEETVLEVTEYDEDGKTFTLFEVTFADFVKPEDYEENFDAAQDRLIVLGFKPSIVDDSELEDEI